MTTTCGNLQVIIDSQRGNSERLYNRLMHQSPNPYGQYLRLNTQVSFTPQYFTTSYTAARTILTIIADDVFYYALKSEGVIQT